MLVVPMAQGLNQTANIVKGFALAIGVAVAIAFVWMWWAHRVRERRLEISSRAKNIYAAHLRTTMQHPELAEPHLGAFDSAVELVRYKQFVANLLATADEILLTEPTAQWRATLARALAPHMSYLSSQEFRASGLADCTPEVNRLLTELHNRTAQPAA